MRQKNGRRRSERDGAGEVKDRKEKGEVREKKGVRTS